MKIALLILFVAASVALAATYPVSISTTNGRAFGTTDISSLVGKINSGNVTNAAGVRVAYLNDVTAGIATNAVQSVYTNGVGLIDLGATNIDFVNGGGITVTGNVVGGTAVIGFSSTFVPGTAAYSNTSAFDLSGAAQNATNKLNADLRASLQSGSTILSNVVSGASNRYIGSFAGKIASGEATNTAGSRVAYLSDVGTVTATNVNDVYSYVLSNAVAIGATGMFVDRTFLPPPTIAGHVAIGFGQTNCEIRPSKSVTGNSVAWDRALTFPHASGERVVWFGGDSVNFAYWGAVPDSGTDVSYSLVNAMHESGQEVLWLDGSFGSYYTRFPLVANRGARIRSIQINAITGYTGVGHTNAYMLWNSQGLRTTFTATAADDTITTPSDWDPPANATNSIVIFYGIGGTNLPAPLSNGIPYFIKAYTATTMKVGLSTNIAEVVNITADGTGFAYTEVGSLERLYLHDVYVHAQSQVGLNGIWASMQQPAYWSGYVRADNFGGTAFKFTGQDMVVERLQTHGCGVSLDTRGWMGQAGMQFFKVGYYNPEEFTNSWLLGGSYNYVESIHMETPLSTAAPIIDGTFESASLFVKNLYVSMSNNTNTVLKVGTSGGFCVDYNIEYGTVNAAFDSVGLLLDDQFKHRQIQAYNSTNGTLRSFDRLQSSQPPTGAGYSDMWSGMSKIGPDGRAWHVGMHYGPWMRLFIGTNDTTDIFQVLRPDGSTNSGHAKNGNIFVNTNYVASDFIPVVGKATFPMSNAVLYMVTQTKTNVISDGR